MPSLSRVLGSKVNLSIKRDDLLPGAAGGNKTRKLEFCIADAMENGADTIITCGAVQSNHCRLTAAWSAKEGLDCHLILEERVEGSYKKEGSGNNFLFELLDVKTINVVTGGSDMVAEMTKKAEELAAQLGIQTGVNREDFVCFDQYVGPGYSIPTDSMVEAVKLFARTEAILLDPVYSGKAAT